MKVMLDTNICIFLIKHQPPPVLARFREYKVGDVGISSVTLSELSYGVAKSLHKEKNSEALDTFVLPLEVASYDEEAARVYGELRARLEKSGTPIGSMDLLIAAHAVSLGVTLATNNTREFTRVFGLDVADWTL